MWSAFKTILVVFLASVIYTTAFAQASVVLPCHEDAGKCAAELRAQSPVKKIQYWKFAFRKPVEERIGSAPDELVAFLNFDNIAAGISNKPQPARIPDHFLNDVKDAFAELPAEVKKLASKKLAGIYFVNDLGGTGYTDDIDNGKSGAGAGFIVLDIDVLSKSSANTWATWKERTPFVSDHRYRLDTRIETEERDNRKNAIQYILLHELGHIFSIGEKVHPQWGQSGGKIPLDRYPFSLLSWEYGDRNDSTYPSRFEARFPLRKNIVYYFGAKLNSNQMSMVYDQLEGTNFPTLYAATSPGDDFAESLVSYVHTIMLKRPLEISIYRDGRIVKIYTSCWEEVRCAEKRRFMENFLKLR